jgi:hypothetical protein
MCLTITANTNSPGLRIMWMSWNSLAILNSKFWLFHLGLSIPTHSSYPRLAPCGRNACFITHKKGEINFLTVSLFVACKAKVHVYWHCLGQAAGIDKYHTQKSLLAPSHLFRPCTNFCANLPFRPHRIKYHLHIYKCENTNTPWQNWIQYSGLCHMCLTIPAHTYS